MPLLRLLHLPLRRRRRRPGGRSLLRMRRPLVLRGRPLVLRGRPLVLLRGAHRDGAVGLGHAIVVALVAAVTVVEVAGRLLVEAVVGAGPVAGRGPVTPAHEHLLALPRPVVVLHGSRGGGGSGGVVHL